MAQMRINVHSFALGAWNKSICEQSAKDVARGFSLALGDPEGSRYERWEFK